MAKANTTPAKAAKKAAPAAKSAAPVKAKAKPVTTEQGYDPFNGLVERIGETVHIHRKGKKVVCKSVKEAQAAMQVAIADATF